MRQALALALCSVLAIAPVASASDEPANLQALIDAAPAGSTLVLAAGVYTGGAVVDKPLTIDGAGSALIDAGGVGHGIEVLATDVTIRGVTIRSSGDSLDREDAGLSADGAARLRVEGCRFENVLFGVYVRESPETTIVGNVIGSKDLDLGRRGDALRVWGSPDSLVEGNIVDGGRDSVMWFSDGIVVRGNRLTNGRYGLHFMYNGGAVVADNVLEGNSVGAFMMYSDHVTFSGNFVAGNFGPSGYGLGLKEVDGMSAFGNHFVGNRVGIYLDNSPLTAGITQSFTENLFAFNEIGVLFTPSVERNHFSANAFVDNREQVGVAGSGRLEGNEWSIEGVGNYWDDFSGYDADGDGIGDIPYRLDDVYSALTDRHPEISLFADTPASLAVNLTARLFPALRPTPKVVDENPLIRMPDIAPPPSGVESANTSALILLSAAMVGAATGLMAVGGRRSWRRS